MRPRKSRYEMFLSPRGGGGIACLAMLLAVFGLGVVCSTAVAAGSAPGWEVTQAAYPTNLLPGQEGTIEATIYNVGGAVSAGSFTVSDALPEHVTLVRAVYVRDPLVDSPSTADEEEPACSTGAVLVCTIARTVLPGEPVKLRISVDVAAGVTSSAANMVTVSGGGAGAPASDSQTLSFGGSEPTHLGLASVDGWFSSPDGTTDTQAGSHPYAFTTAFTLDTVPGANGEVELAGGQELRNIEFRLPPGMVGDAAALTQCPRQQLDIGENVISCPAASQIGIDVFSKARPGGGVYSQAIPVFNMVPPPGMPAQFGGSIAGEDLFLDASVRSGGDYGITEHIENVPQYNIISNVITIWGVPAEASHNTQRGSECLQQDFASEEQAGTPLIECLSGAALTPFLTMPTSCGAPLEFSMSANSWQDGNQTTAGTFSSHGESGVPVGVTGCERLTIEPSITIAPDTAYADTPAGLTVNLKVPQEGLTASTYRQTGSSEALASADLKNTTVTLPEGLVINPGQATGLAACQEAEAHLGGENEEAPSCPSASKVGEDEIETPLLAQAVKGDVYVLQSNPPNLKLLVAASGEGVNLKLVGDVHLNETTGRLTTSFTETPELPFTDFKLTFSGGAQAALVTPTGCGLYTSGADFTPWSSPLSPDVLQESSFAIDAGTGGTACSSPLAFTPTLSAGSTTDQAGGYTDFTMLLQRADDQQRIAKLQFTTPTGLLGMISKVPLCQEPQAAAGECPAASQIGHTVVESGPGPYPFVLPENGQPPAPIYLTGPYGGAPYGLSIKVPVIAGPFNLGTVIVRASIAVNPLTAQLTITTSPLPTILDGIPTDVRTINAVIDREGFMFNPTNCKAQSFSGTATSEQGTTAVISSPFQMGSCRSLPFAPDFKVSTAGQSSKAMGASLVAKIVYPTLPPEANQASTQANIASVKVDLPKQLPSQLRTLQKACLAAVFEANPANCPPESIVGHAVVNTPVLPVPLTGPAYFVSHGGEAFPSLILVLQGYGVTVDLVGATFIHDGITSSTFKSTPDVPFSTFELNLPQGKYSALAANLPASANGSFCGQKLEMPTAFVGQNGTEIHETTPVEVTGCPDSLVVYSHTVKSRTVSLSVYVPAAGKLTATGKGLAKASKASTGRETLTLKLKATKSGYLATKLKLSFAPSKGKKLTKNLAVKLKA